ncbi:IclR family transcriptional regulator [Burkholderia pseudomallei]|uniref:IclR family transcriptional regulator n=1 Tax=Burkholderia pseudomallei TaxID=28450 RepID=UPI00040AF59B|nr:IclR family transcriptional regulator [Burkholderia pseudomallei]KGW44428.1 iclR helix-turn-helix domain protein [Burkholderia pseudomallei MSHR684]AIP54210.1 bacterial transcriptional regulator family protein [Burkholderia pseudomallei HBPUB10134a]AIV56888.1 iclR helix-turn-helix domain protein [Burkholderia pseudomallei MSHR2243]AIV69258.1 bacterial transcriptional regulator family protein [Burkholderia pseudomallei MSHR62]AIV75748.1 iclR helix-turn-helix domain protein [Burkholderia pseu
MSEPLLKDADDARNDSNYVVPGLERGLRILAEFSPREPVLGAPELSKRLGIPRTTVFRLLQTLESLGFLERADKDRNYRLGVAVLRLGFEYLSSLELTDLGLPVIESLRDATGFTAHIVIRDGRDVVFVAKAQNAGNAFGSVRVNVGTRLPAHATTHGHVLMGDLSLAQLRALYPERALERVTKATPETVDALFDVIRDDARRGYGIGNSAFERDISVVTAPVRNEASRIVAVVTVTVPRPEIDAALIAEGLVEKVVRAAAELSRRLNYRSDDENTYLKALGLR